MQCAPGKACDLGKHRLEWGRLEQRDNLLWFGGQGALAGRNEVHTEFGRISRSSSNNWDQDRGNLLGREGIQAERTACTKAGSRRELGESERTQYPEWQVRSGSISVALIQQPRLQRSRGISGLALRKELSDKEMDPIGNKMS